VSPNDRACAHVTRPDLPWWWASASCFRRRLTDTRSVLSRWRTNWRTSRKIPANRHVLNVSKTVIRRKADRGFKSLPLRFRNVITGLLTTGRDRDRSEHRRYAQTARQLRGRRNLMSIVPSRSLRLAAAMGCQLYARCSSARLLLSRTALQRSRPDRLCRAKSGLMARESSPLRGGSTTSNASMPGTATCRRTSHARATAALPARRSAAAMRSRDLRPTVGRDSGSPASTGRPRTRPGARVNAPRRALVARWLGPAFGPPDVRSHQT
jgi:hypothetical protein